MTIESIAEALQEHNECENNPQQVSFEECDNPKCRAAQVELVEMVVEAA